QTRRWSRGATCWSPPDDRSRRRRRPARPVTVVPTATAPATTTQPQQPRQAVARVTVEPLRLAHPPVPLPLPPQLVLRHRVQILVAGAHVEQPPLPVLRDRRNLRILRLVGHAAPPSRREELHRCAHVDFLAAEAALWDFCMNSFSGS